MKLKNNYMTATVKKIRSAKTLSAALKEIKPVRYFDANRHKGKVKWNEDPLEYQNRLRNEWD
jgi:hypothetical protein